MNCFKCEKQAELLPYLNFNFKTVHLCKDCHLGACKAETYLSKINSVGLDENKVAHEDLAATYEHIMNAIKILQSRES